MPHEPVGRLLRPGWWPEGFADSPADRDALVVLSHMEGLLPRTLREAAALHRRASRCLAAVRSGHIGSAGDREILDDVDVHGVRAALSGCGARQVAPGDPEYPARLTDLRDPPACLYVRGSPLDKRTTVSIVGARACSPYGRETGVALGAGIASAGVAVCSGAALGVDAAAHKGALSARGDTIAVLGSGIDVAYPRRNRALIERIAEVGTVCSEYPPGVRPEPRRFPARNRIVAALADAAVVVEGAAGSGSLLTAEFAMELGREVLAVPGPVTSPLSAAPHELIRDGAGLVTGPDHVLEAIGVDRPGETGPSVPGLEDEEARVLGALTGAAITLDDVARRAGLDPGAALGALVALELRGLVRGVGGRYERSRSGAGI